MEKGDILLIPFPFTDLSGKKTDCTKLRKQNTLRKCTSKEQKTK